jgi:predicted PurR-regulated permease PerM
LAEKNKYELAKTLAVILIPAGFLIAIFYLLWQWITGQQLINLWQKQYEDYVNEFKQYAEQDNGNITPEHQEILNRKENILQQTEASIMQTLTVFWNNLFRLAELALWIATTYLAIKAAPDVIRKWADLIKGRGGTAKAMTYAARCVLIEDYAQKGQTTLASVLATITHNYFNTVDAPFMQAEIARYQQIAQTASGWMYYYALFMIQYYTIELSSIPYWFSMLPPLPPPPT